MAAKAAKSPRCSIVIRTFNEEKHIERLLAAIQTQTLKDVEIVLVDSGSTDHTLEITANFPVQILHILPRDFTFGRSLNKGISAASGEIIVLASAHVYPMNEDWLEQLIAPFEDPQMALSYGKQRGGEGSKFSEDQHFRSWFPDLSEMDQDRAYANNANAAIRRSFWEKNHFDEELTGLEDVAWASWAREQGYKIAYIAEAGVIHHHDESAAQIINRHRREAIALKQILPESRFTLRNFLSLSTRSIFSDFAAARKEKVLLRETIGIKRFRALQYWGTYLGYRQSGELSPELRQVFYYPPGSLAVQNGASGNEKKPVRRESNE
jgi:glycosyltransferase involved in cell wall biosynthesis